MSFCAASQILVGIAIVFDIMSFQFKERRKIVLCLFESVILISTHFFLLSRQTAGLLMLVATSRSPLPSSDILRSISAYPVLPLGREALRDMACREIGFASHGVGGRIDAKRGAARRLPREPRARRRR